VDLLGFGLVNGFILKYSQNEWDFLPEGTRRLAAIMFTDMAGYTALGQ